MYFIFTARTRETNSKYSGSNEGNSLVQKKEELSFTGKSLSDALIFAEHGENMLCTEIVLNVKNNFMFSPCSEPGMFMYWTCNSMNNLSSYCGLVDAKIGTSYKDLPAHKFLFKMALNFLAKFVVISTVKVVFSCIYNWASG